MLRVALTGGLSSGKTLVAGMFRELGCFVSQSDEVARGMMQPGEAVYADIVRVFGTGVVCGDGTLDRGALARLAFREGCLEKLNDLVHPAVIARQAAWMRGVEAAHPRGVAIIESALVFETRHGNVAGETGDASWRTRFDRIVVVTASEEVRVQRYVARVGASTHEARAAAEADAWARMRTQMPDAEKAALADFVICNEGLLEELHTEVERVWGQLQIEAEDSADAAM